MRKTTMTNGQTRALLQAIQIMNQEFQNPDKLGKALKEISDAIEVSTKKDATKAPKPKS